MTKTKKPKWYKVLHRDRDLKMWVGTVTTFDYTPYLPQKGKPGKVLRLPEGKKLRNCKSGFHVTTMPWDWDWGRGDADTRIYEVRIIGEALKPVGNKRCCRALCLLRLVKRGSAEHRRLCAPPY